MVQQYRDDTDNSQSTEDRTPSHRADVEVRPEAEVDPVYRGFKAGSAFFGWLVAIGLTALLTGIIGAVVAAVDYAVTIERSEIERQAGSIGLVTAGAVLLVLAIAYYNGGYVAGRLARFDGARQGVGVWFIGLLVTVLVAVIAGLAESQYNLLDRDDLPSGSVSDQDLTTGGLIAAAAVVVVTLVAAVIGGKAGQRYHRRIDRSA